MTRARLPNRRRCETVKAVVAGQHVYVRLSRYDDGRVAEVFIRANKTGTALLGCLDAIGILASIALQHGASAEEVASAIRGIEFAPDGAVNGYELVQRCTSIVDFVAQLLLAEAGSPVATGAAT